MAAASVRPASDSLGGDSFVDDASDSFVDDASDSLETDASDSLKSDASDSHEADASDSLKSDACDSHEAEASSALESQCFYYFAYGSNLLGERVAINSPSAIFVAAAKLEGEGGFKPESSWGGE